MIYEFIGLTVTILAAMGAGVAWLTNQIKENRDELKADIKRVEDKLSSDIKRVEEKLTGDIKRVEDNLSGDIKRVEDNLSGDIKRVEDKLDTKERELRQDFRSDVEKVAGEAIEQKMELQRVSLRGKAHAKEAHTLRERVDRLEAALRHAMPQLDI